MQGNFMGCQVLNFQKSLVENWVLYVDLSN